MGVHQSFESFHAALEDNLLRKVTFRRNSLHIMQAIPYTTGLRRNDLHKMQVDRLLQTNIREVGGYSFPLLKQSSFTKRGVFCD
jgi:hypothetical protein